MFNSRTTLMAAAAAISLVSGGMTHFFTAAVMPPPAARQASAFVGRIFLDSLTWSGHPGGVQLATVEGDPMAADKPYTVAIRLGDGAWIQPHWHPRIQHLAVLGGTLLLGNGDDIDSNTVTVLDAGQAGIISAAAHHYEGGRGPTTVLIYGIGPMATTFVKPRAP